MKFWHHLCQKINTLYERSFKLVTCSELAGSLEPLAHTKRLKTACVSFKRSLIVTANCLKVFEVTEIHLDSHMIMINCLLLIMFNEDHN